MIDRVGNGVSRGRLGQRVWVRFANQHSPLGTAAEYVTVPAHHAVALPDRTPFEVGACLGIPALTAYGAVHCDGPVDGAVVLVTGAAGAVGRYAAQFASHAGAVVIATASTSEKQAAARRAGARHVLDYRQRGVAERILALTDGHGVDRVVDVAFGANLELTSRVLADNGIIASYGSDAEPEPRVPFYPLMRRGATIRLISVFRMPSAALRVATNAITHLLATDVLSHLIAARFSLSEAAAAHEFLEKGRAIGKTLLQIAGSDHQARPPFEAVN